MIGKGWKDTHLHLATIDIGDFGWPMHEHDNISNERNGFIETVAILQQLRR